MDEIAAAMTALASALSSARADVVVHIDKPPPRWNAHPKRAHRALTPR
ncbi:hypothetical protein MTX26_33460 [Bradyrhizobium sp. ISRA443]|nr:MULTISPECIES: hypothetical protein [unclassified Bradyrhizobium]WGR99042.1 hypothetical protein MTX23_33440 [Bradyrhizobium sp. ISRA436]WGS05933.1 hypothetical protein MTX18_33460 [Bradyrhizobium sp. ISRA437]WGS12819.1 hypothetical protein MTX26_33460 [Bradyrhizobium sp. ISRA443]